MQKIFYFYVVILLWGCNATSLTTGNNCKSELDSFSGVRIYTVVDSNPEFPGGMEDALKFFVENYKHPEQEYFQATFILEFIIAESGDLIQPRIRGKEQGQLTNAEKEAIRVLSIMPKWKPGKCEGKEVAVRTYLPIR